MKTSIINGSEVSKLSVAIQMISGAIVSLMFKKQDNNLITIRWLVEWPPESPDNQYHLFK